MITTLTLNPALDFTLYLPGFIAPGTLHRSVSSNVTQGGKGTNVSLALLALGVSSNAVALLGGENGGRFARIHEEYGLTLTAVPAAADTRMNVKVIDAAGGGTEFNQSSPATDAELAAADVEIGRTARGEGDILVLSGSLPRGADTSLYARLCAKYRALGVYVAVDCDGDALRLCLDSDVPPSLIKPNAYELSRYTGKVAEDMDEIADQCREINARTGAEVLCTADSRGALLATAEGVWRCPAPKVTVRGFTGAGDTALAAYLYASKIKGESPEQSLRLAVSASAAKVELEGTRIPTAEQMLSKLSVISN